MTDTSGTIQAQLAYDPFGRLATMQGSQAPDFQFGGYYAHATSKLNLTPTRSYLASLGRWISRDADEEQVFGNPYPYVDNQPTDAVDPTGMKGSKGTAKKGGAAGGTKNGGNKGKKECRKQSPKKSSPPGPTPSPPNANRPPTGVHGDPFFGTGGFQQKPPLGYSRHQ